MQQLAGGAALTFGSGPRACFQIRGGKIRPVLYNDRESTFADLGIAPEASSSGT
jgi:hypothetical protein